MRENQRNTKRRAPPGRNATLDAEVELMELVVDLVVGDLPLRLLHGANEVPE